MSLPEIRTAPVADIQIPVEFQKLYDLAYNLWWTWNREALLLFQRIDPVRWHHDHNPVELLINVEPHRWDALLVDTSFAEAYEEVVGTFQRYLDETDLERLLVCRPVRFLSVMNRASPAGRALLQAELRASRRLEAS